VAKFKAKEKTQMTALKNRAEVAELVIDAMVTNGQSLRKCCIQVGIDPARFLRAVDASPELAKQYARARQALLDKMADEILELADAPVPVLDNGATDNALVRQRQLQVDTRKWFLSKLAPKVYGDRLDVSVTDSRISITGALQAAQSRLVDDVTDITPRIAHAENANENEGGGRAEG
jgi:DNA-binding helix-hairpin-helix protein with protein kinase domain